MTITVEAAVRNLQKEWTDFKQLNDAAIAEARKHGDASAEAKTAADRANEAVTAVQDAIKEIRDQQAEEHALVEGLENRLNRPGIGERNGAKKYSDIQIENYAAFESRAKGEEIDPGHVDLDFIAAYRDAFTSYLARGESSLSSEQRTLLNELSVGSDENGGFTVDPDTSGRVVEFIRETSPIREYTNPVTIDRGDSHEGDYDLDEAGSGGWVGEIESRPGNTDTPETWRYRIPIHEQYAEPRATQRFLDQTRRTDAETWLVRKVGRRFRRDENTSFVTGSGVHRPRGFATYGAGTPATTSVAAYQVIQQVNTGDANLLASDGVVDLVFSLKSEYRAGSIFGGTRLTESAVRQLKDGQGNYLWQPDFTQRTNSTLVGFPFVEFADMAEVAAAALPLVFGNLAEAYQPVDQGAMTMLRDPYTTKGRVKFYTTKYVGGDVVNFEAIKLQKVSA